MASTPKNRQEKVTGGNGNIHRRGDGLGTGPVGTGARSEGTSAKTGSSGKPNGTGKPGAAGKTPGNAGGSNQEAPQKGLLSSLLLGGMGSGSSSGGGGKGKFLLIALVAVLLLGGGGGLTKCLGGGNGGGGTTVLPTSGGNTNIQQGSLDDFSDKVDLSSILSSLGISDVIGGSGQSSYSGAFGSLLDLAGTDTSSESLSSSTNSSNSWNGGTNAGLVELDDSVDETARKKFTKIKGKGKDVVTLMVYMCGADLESSYGCGTSDLQEMINAKIANKNVNLLVYTGGAKKWKNNVVSNSTNMIFQIKNGKITALEKDLGNLTMTDPDTLSSFIRYCAENFPANRYELIFWDHGGGSVTGYGYDEKHVSAGSMDLAGIQTALEDGGVKFDMIGFDACLMATCENALMLSEYGHYMVASEESEPGIGWYYTDWLADLDADTSLSTVEMGKEIVDSFVETCGSKCRGQSATLSVTDLAEFAAVIPNRLSEFSTATSNLVNKEYAAVSKARSRSHEFAQSSGIDQVDLTDFAIKLGTEEGNELAEAIQGAVKYNRTSSDVTNAYGISIYFPYRSTSYVDKAVKTYKKIGLDDDYSNCIKNFASMEVSGQIASGGTANQLGSLLGLLGGDPHPQPQPQSTDMLSGLLGSFFGGGSSSSSGSGIGSLIAGLVDTSVDGGGNTGFLSGRALSNDEAAEYIIENSFDVSQLNWVEGEDGTWHITLSKDQWALVTELALSVYYDDGESFIDLGVDNIFSFDAQGNLLAPEDPKWLSINGQAVAYYFDSLTDDGKNFCIQGHVPALLNGVWVNLILCFDNENPYGYVAGAIPVYKDGETELQAKSITDINAGDAADVPADVDVLAEEKISMINPGDTLDFLCDYYSYEGEYLDSYMLGDQMTVPEEGMAGLEIASVVLDEDCANMMYRFRDIYNQVYWSQDITN